MDEERKSVYDDLKRDLRGFPVEDFVRAYLRAYLDADVESIRKLQEFLLGKELPREDAAGADEPGKFVGAPIKPRPNLNSGAIALPEPEPVKPEDN
jgi:hypothetical protein